MDCRLIIQARKVTKIRKVCSVPSTVSFLAGKLYAAHPRQANADVTQRRAGPALPFRFRLSYTSRHARKNLPRARRSVPVPRPFDFRLRAVEVEPGR